MPLQFYELDSILGILFRYPHPYFEILQFYELDSNHITLNADVIVKACLAIL